MPQVTPELSEFLGGQAEISRGELTKFFWAYVKENDCLVQILISFNFLIMILMTVSILYTSVMNGDRLRVIEGLANVDS